MSHSSDSGLACHCEKSRPLTSLDINSPLRDFEATLVPHYNAAPSISIRWDSWSFPLSLYERVAPRGRGRVMEDKKGRVLTLPLCTFYPRSLQYLFQYPHRICHEPTTPLLFELVRFVIRSPLFRADIAPQ